MFETIIHSEIKFHRFKNLANRHLVLTVVIDYDCEKMISLEGTPAFSKIERKMIHAVWNIH